MATRDGVPFATVFWLAAKLPPNGAITLPEVCAANYAIARLVEKHGNPTRVDKHLVENGVRWFYRLYWDPTTERVTT